MKRLAGMAAVFLMSAAHSQTPASGPAAAATPEPQISAPAAAEVAAATVYIEQAWKDFAHCRRASACNEYFESFGVAISFGDGSIAPFSHIQRLTATSHDCIKTAMAYLHQGDKSLALQWAMARLMSTPG